MERLVFERSYTKNAGLLLLSLMFVAGGVYMATTANTGSDRLIGWVCAAFFALGVLAVVRNLLRGGTAFVFDLSGIKDESSGLLIPWSEIGECMILVVRGTRLLAVSFKNPDQFLMQVSPAKQKMARFNQSLGWGHWGFTFSDVNPGIDEAWRFIRENVPHLQAVDDERVKNAADDS
ncbi:MAG TPA: STM3941 family protein [Thermoanaerobaculia bacterium]|nr:STM3941 family protein [Thermoanaerobaculia bacterium]